MKLVSDWQQAWRWNSVHAMAAAAALQGAWAAVPDSLRQYASPHVVTGVTIALLVLGFIGRLRDQTPAPKPPTSNDFHQRDDA